ncbi:thiamine phosphate synthase [Parabacteroides sp. OttesenSCG-928-N08]|nr:thiamine phosphate synthase [Parabacteroides sp. OttesenSCG-928-N08]
MNKILTDAHRLMLVTHPTPTLSETEEVRMALAGGCRWIQLRMKNGVTLETAKEVVQLCRDCSREALLFIDDEVEMALLAGADGVHLGKQDMPLQQAWQLVEKHGRRAPFYIGATANSFEDIEAACHAGASYIGLGPFRFTETKSRLSPLLGIEGINRVIKQSRKAGIQLPIYAIGGIELSDVAPLLQAGATGVAVSGAIVGAADPETATRQFMQQINHIK